MTPRDFCQSGRAEGVKGAVHVVLMGISLTCFAYNAAAWVFRRDRHLLANTLLYGGLAAVEAYQVARHWEDS